jgi:hypothetical protein
MANLHDEDAFIESVRNDLLQAYKKASDAGTAGHVEVAESAIVSVHDAEAAVLTAENAVSVAEAVMEKPAR